MRLNTSLVRFRTWSCYKLRARSATAWGGARRRMADVRVWAAHLCASLRAVAIIVGIWSCRRGGAVGVGDLLLPSLACCGCTSSARPSAIQQGPGGQILGVRARCQISRTACALSLRDPAHAWPEWDEWCSWHATHSSIWCTAARTSLAGYHRARDYEASREVALGPARPEQRRSAVTHGETAMRWLRRRVVSRQVGSGHAVRQDGWLSSPMLVDSPCGATAALLRA
jgi:hypothetical protein